MDEIASHTRILLVNIILLFLNLLLNACIYYIYYFGVFCFKNFYRLV